ncbi:hypothetical protein AYI70_g9386 [Smittium culicis]|uniref:Uncharacterized protein n=1 Tax=Smittium culicis TaxID=133412 RepID=A0A1R1XBI7_9FUNG|nr:hypothetical protein AYI70_g9386 [Smittium culicis]
MRIVAFGLDNYGQTSKVSKLNYHIPYPPPPSTSDERESLQKNDISTPVIQLDPKSEHTGSSSYRKSLNSINFINPKQIYYSLRDATSISNTAFSDDAARAAGSCEFIETPNCVLHTVCPTVVAANTHQTVVYSQRFGDLYYKK